MHVVVLLCQVKKCENDGPKTCSIRSEANFKNGAKKKAKFHEPAKKVMKNLKTTDFTESIEAF